MRMFFSALLSLGLFASIASASEWTVTQDLTGTAWSVTLRSPTTQGTKITGGYLNLTCENACDVWICRDGTTSSNELTSLTSPAILSVSNKATTRKVRAFAPSTTASDTCFSLPIASGSGVLPPVPLTDIMLTSPSDQFTVKVTMASSGRIAGVVQVTQE